MRLAYVLKHCLQSALSLSPGKEFMQAFQAIFTSQADKLHGAWLCVWESGQRRADSHDEVGRVGGTSICSILL